MTNVRLSLPTVIGLVAIASAGAFAAGRSTSSPPPAPAAASPTAPPGPTPLGGNNELPPGHPVTGAPLGGDLPAGHPPVGASPESPSAPAADNPASLAWTAPPRWQKAPNTSSMRLATYRVPRADGDKDDAELSVTQAGGSVDANVERWIGQFDAEGQKTAKRTTRKVGSLDVTIVEVQGTYSGGMGKAPAAGEKWALLGAIVGTPGMPHFFKLTGPAKTVLAARSELDALVSSVKPTAN